MRFSITAVSMNSLSIIMVDWTFQLYVDSFQTQDEVAVTRTIHWHLWPANYFIYFKIAIRFTDATRALSLTNSAHPHQWNLPRWHRNNARGRQTSVRCEKGIQVEFRVIRSSGQKKLRLPVVLIFLPCRWVAEFPRKTRLWAASPVVTDASLA